ncbi:hypothetical protein DPMN_178998 [Dreissena polymorpha]|uniref:Uncharacterized protein n=1 Tax=Dreissena polymorpha TaxID=45954 RepID=A0A9D4EF96_DREPO|nr:hypothetical protein DPMN_178998 [Dreissena polymorpha]
MGNGWETVLSQKPSFTTTDVKTQSVVQDCSHRLAEKIGNADNGLAAKIRLIPENKIGMKFNDNH